LVLQINSLSTTKTPVTRQPVLYDIQHLTGENFTFQHQ